MRHYRDLDYSDKHLTIKCKNLTDTFSINCVKAAYIMRVHAANNVLFDVPTDMTAFLANEPSDTIIPLEK